MPGPQTRKYTVLVEEDLAEWGKRQPGGLSSLIRSLLAEARAQSKKRLRAGRFG
jgi:hypothetical protein